MALLEQGMMGSWWAAPPEATLMLLLTPLYLPIMGRRNTTFNTTKSGSQPLKGQESLYESEASWLVVLPEKHT